MTFFGRHEKVALAAADQPRERKLAMVGTGFFRATEELLDTLELFNGNHGDVRTFVGMAFPDKEAAVKRGRENAIDRAQSDRFSADALVLGRPKAPIVPGNLPNALR